jgi:hypothetical protein
MNSEEEAQKKNFETEMQRKMEIIANHEKIKDQKLIENVTKFKESSF